MTDMLVKLYDLPELHPVLVAQQAAGIDIRRALAAERNLIMDWVHDNFSDLWAGECKVALSNHPLSCFIAIENAQLIGFACHDAACKGFFGPIGVDKSAQGKDIGKALLLACLHDMYARGYGYAIIGAVGPVEFYQKVVGAIVIEDSTPGIYRGLLKR
jgi:GNAT superfamily N-acetyltransferase